MLIFLVWFGFTSHQHCKGYMANLQLYWWRKTTSAPLWIISGTSGHLSRTADVPYNSWISSSHVKIRSPWRDSNPRRWEASGSKSSSLTIWPRTPLLYNYKYYSGPVTMSWILYIAKILAWWIRCLSRNLGIVGSNPTRVTAMFPHMTPVLVGSRKRVI